MKDWKEERCHVQPDTEQDIGGGMVIVRKNIKEVRHEATKEQEAYTDWECESKIMSEDEYRMLKAIEEIDASKAVDNYTMQLIEEGLL